VADHTFTEGIGVDLGIKSFAKVSNGQEFKNINKSPPLKRVRNALSVRIGRFPNSNPERSEVKYLLLEAGVT
jgi:putative transposase